MGPSRETAVFGSLLHMRVPTSGFGERDFQPHIGLDKHGDLAQALTQRAIRIPGAVGRAISRRLQFLQHVHGFKGLSTGIAQEILDAVAYKASKP